MTIDAIVPASLKHGKNAEMARFSINLLLLLPEHNAIHRNRIVTGATGL